ncbi:MAG: hypothetical protein ACRBCK_08760 [Alphaproteobacteria bacterium]
MLEGHVKERNNATEVAVQSSVLVSLKNAAFYFLAFVGSIVLLFFICFCSVIAFDYFFNQEHIKYDFSYSDGEYLYIEMQFIEERQQVEDAAARDAVFEHRAKRVVK